MTEQTASDDPDLEGEGEAEGETEGEPRKRRLPGKKLVLFVALPVLLLGAAGGGLYVSGLAHKLLGLEHGAEEEQGMLAEEDHGPSVYYDLPEMLVNLNTKGRKTGYLKISVSLEVQSEEDKEHLERVLPRIVDNFQVYLRELRVEDLSGSAGLQRLREELLLRVSHAAAPTEVKDVLFREMLIQ